MIYDRRLLIPDTALSVAGLTSYIQALIAQDSQLHQVWVTGEVSSVFRHRSGLFFTLQDPDAKAALSCVIWHSEIEQLATLPVPGEQLILLGRIGVHPPKGHYQLVVWQTLPAGEGLRSLRYRQLRDRLEAEGLFDPARKRPIPKHPQVVAVVTSPQAAAWGDIQRTLQHRYPGLQLLFSPALVQGDQAPASIARAIDRIGRDGRAEVLILSRGGGATEDMACFNDERVVRAIVTCPIPVIAGIGHQRDESLADLVADVCAHTPTAAAEQAVPQLSALYTEHRDRIWQLHGAVRNHLELATNQLHQLKVRLHPRLVDRQLQQQTRSLAQLRQRLHQATNHRIQQATQHLQFISQKLVAIDPQEVLRRGYAVVRQKNGDIARSTSALTVGAELSIQLSQGQLKVHITEVTRPASSQTASSQTASSPWIS